MDPIPLLDDTHRFPPVEHALTEPNGLLAAGGDLQPDRLLCAYRQGIFPWYDETGPILWWAPDPRLVLFPERVNISRSLARFIRNTSLTLSIDSAFEQVIAACAAPRRGSDGTWITDEMKESYSRLHRLGIAHSLECWSDQTLVGGLYGISLGQVFFGESMFSTVANASKLALVCLCELLGSWDFHLIDCQVQSDHLLRLGAQEIPRAEFTRYLDQLTTVEPDESSWQASPELGEPGTCRFSQFKVKLS